MCPSVGRQAKRLDGKFSIVVQETGEVIATEVLFARTFFQRLKGLMFKERMDDGCALILEPCNSVHTFFMRFPIDVAFVSKEGRVLEVIKGMKPFRITRIIKGARYVIETPGGTLKALNRGQHVSFMNNKREGFKNEKIN
ncbi:hypothetical protein AN618_23490 [Fervidicola ferrireducens]|uniref:DUF192 domain-containing protein n=1 Tax=Fervidicola ferrireducens TaxID=520764 RepID=A0A140L178_9FIRM|nr:DUF192 domain-containing protein [Fervidicola ferrireducens]KXG74303.1 hypothetical protein AN618_23490 [Fervidicola ferrireducens]